jgi:hypothetical protein
LIDFAVRFEQRAEFGFGGAMREIAYKKFLHGIPFSCAPTQTSDFVGRLSY